MAKAMPRRTSNDAIDMNNMDGDKNENVYNDDNSDNGDEDYDDDEDEDDNDYEG
jgi:hypothetical protein